MRLILALLSTFFMSSLVHADDFELNVYFDLGVAEKHDIVHCAIGGRKLKTEYHLTVFKDKPRYTFLGNLDLEKNVAGDVERKFLCNEGKFILKKTINTSENFINLFVYLEETYFLKDQIFDVANVKLSPGEDYFIQKKYISESGKTIVETMNVEEDTRRIDDDIIMENTDLVYSVEIKRL